MVHVTQTVPGFDRLTVEPGKLGGQVCIRSYRFGVQQLLQLLARGVAFEQIQEDFPFLEPADMHQALAYAASLLDRDFYVPASLTA